VSILGGIFVGGASSRMGRAKGLLRGPSGEALVVQIAERLRAAGVTPVLVGVRPEYAGVGLPAIADARAGAGPLGGLVALLEAAGTQPALAVACDMPWVDAPLLARLVSAPPAAVVAPRDSGRWEPLCARYDPAAVLALARDRLAHDQLALQGLLDAVGATPLALDDAELEKLRDWDTPDVVTDPTTASGTVQRHVRLVRADGATARLDRIVVEEPLEIRARRDGRAAPVAVTMRTPGADVDLAAGFLLGEGIVRTRADVRSIAPDGPSAIVVELSPEADARLDRTTRSFYVTSSCGVCGKASIDAVRAELPATRHPPGPRIPAERILALGDELRRAQHTFEHTGALHAAALFDEDGMLLRLAEDVGRHNAVDKVLGAELLAGRVPLGRVVLFLSGRIAFELVQKAALAGVAVVAAIGGPTSLAVELAESAGITLIGFVRDGRFNVYTGDGV